MRLERWGGLRCRIVEAASGRAEHVVVLLHGFGAPGADLVPLAGALGAPAGTAFVFPEAPLELPWGLDSRAWWMIDIERLERAMSGSGPREIPDEVPPGLPRARSGVLAMLGDVESSLKVPPERVVLGGFSQGAMLACDVALRRDVPPAGLALMSSTLLSSTEWTPLMPRLAGRPVLLSHGTLDPLLPFDVSVTLRDLLIDAGADMRWIPFRGQHEIPPPVLEGLATLVRDVAGGARGAGGAGR